jgi:hypothetical protein
MKSWMGILAAALSIVSNANAMSVLSSEDQSFQRIEQENFMNLQSYALAEANCATTGTCNSTSDNYATLEQYYAGGTIPTASEITGWYTGRCYLKSARTTAKATMLAGFTEIIGGGGGPLFPAKEALKFMVLEWKARSAEAYDNLSPNDAADVASYIESNKANAQTACIADNSLSITYNTRTKWQVRKAQDYLLVKYLANNVTMAYCYYFKKIK